ncbi:MAG TPA: glutamate 5-kinase [Saprospiraceae bacterium]|nr:glutamate 5-kinase [Saprospiraceae bacterium]
MEQFKKIVVKLGTNVLTKGNGLLDITNISHLVDQLAELKQKGIEVILISSGAVGAGRSMMEVSSDLSKIVRRQVFSAIGQIKLVNTYSMLFANHDIFCAQVLATKEDFRDRMHYLNMKNCFLALLRDKVIPIVNENDVVAVSELMFTDNDELAGLIASMINADALIILSSVDGVLDGSPDDPNSKVIAEIDPLDKKMMQLVFPTKSSFGRGGMSTKMRIARKAAKVGITTFIANGKRANILLNILNGNYTGTKFKATNSISNLKKWIAYNELEKKGLVQINKGAAEALCSTSKVSSLLPVGIIHLEGDFSKGDIVQIINEQKEQLGLGIAQYGIEKAKEWMGLKNKKPLIHYDYLFIN